MSPPLQRWPQAVRTFFRLRLHRLQHRTFRLADGDARIRPRGHGLPAGAAEVVDAFTIFQRKEPRDLATAYRFYCGKVLDRAHSAEADASAALDILLAQVGRYDDLARDVSGLHKFCHAKKPDWLDPAGKIVWRNDKAVLSFGKYKNRPLDQLASEDPEYLKWIAQADFSQEVISIARAALEGDFPSRGASPSPTTVAATTSAA